jgi:hypothetical protein
MVSSYLLDVGGLGRLGSAILAKHEKKLRRDYQKGKTNFRRGENKIEKHLDLISIYRHFASIFTLSVAIKLSIYFNLD